MKGARSGEVHAVSEDPLRCDEAGIGFERTRI